MFKDFYKKHPVIFWLIVIYLILSFLSGCSSLRTLKEETQNKDYSIVKIERSIPWHTEENTKGLNVDLKGIAVLSTKVAE